MNLTGEVQRAGHSKRHTGIDVQIVFCLHVKAAINFIVFQQRHSAAGAERVFKIVIVLTTGIGDIVIADVVGVDIAIVALYAVKTRCSHSGGFCGPDVINAAVIAHLESSTVLDHNVIAVGIYADIRNAGIAAVNGYIAVNAEIAQFDIAFGGDAAIDPLGAITSQADSFQRDVADISGAVNHNGVTCGGVVESFTEAGIPFITYGRPGVIIPPVAPVRTIMVLLPGRYLLPVAVNPV